MQDFIKQFHLQISSDLLLNESLSKHTTMGVGGVAEYFFVAKTKDQLIKAYHLAKKFKISVTILGGGSNVIIPDQGLSGLVIKNQILDLKIIDTVKNPDFKHIKPRIGQIAEVVEKDQVADYLIDEDLSSFDESTEQVYLEIGSGWRLNALILKCFALQITGLEWFGGIPGSIGGAVYMNIHGGEHFFSEFLVEIEALNDQGELIILKNKDLKFAYDYSLLHQQKIIVLSTKLKLYRGDVEQAKQIFNWAKKKIIAQPQRSAGCIFQNLSQEQQQSANLPTPSVGYLIDKVLNLKGYRIGGAQISQKHATFIENVDQASAQDVLDLINLIKQKAKEKLDLDLHLEIEILS